MQAASRKKGAGITSQHWDLILVEIFPSYLLHFTLTTGFSVFSSNAIPPGTEVTRCIHSLSLAGHANHCNHSSVKRTRDWGRQLSEAWTDNKRNAPKYPPVRATLKSSLQHQFRSSYLFMTALKHVTLGIDICMFIYMPKIGIFPTFLLGDTFYNQTAHWSWCADNAASS